MAVMAVEIVIVVTLLAYTLAIDEYTYEYCHKSRGKELYHISQEKYLKD